MSVPSSAWFVGAQYNGNEDKTADFLSRGVWENGYADRYLDEVRGMKPGDRIAIKSSFVSKPGSIRQPGTPGKAVSTMRIKAIGTIRENPGDGRRVLVDWEQGIEYRDWYFYTGRQTVWHVKAGDWKADALLSFTFAGVPQDIDRFRNAPYWRHVYGDSPGTDPDMTARTAATYDWVLFFEALRVRLLDFVDDRAPLLEILRKINQPTGGFPLNDRDADENLIPLRDICPFTVLAFINRGISLPNRIRLCNDLARELELDVPAPTGFDGVPLVNNQSTWFFSYLKHREPDDIDVLWRVLELADAWYRDQSPESRAALIEGMDRALRVRKTKWNLSFGLFWLLPHVFLPLDSRTRLYLRAKTTAGLAERIPHQPPTGAEYLNLRDAVAAYLQQRTEPPNSMVELSCAAFTYADLPAAEPLADDDAPNTVHWTGIGDTMVADSKSAPEFYGIEQLRLDGCFAEIDDIAGWLEQWRRKKNMILQGAPGTGKTWMAQRLGWVLAGQRRAPSVMTMQFHPGMSYEDFVRGYRPGPGQSLECVDGPFMELATQARSNPSVPHVMVIEEINRGNPAQIFGELLTLLEASKRSAEHAIQLAHAPRSGQRREYLPENLHVIGTMNLADRSIAMVDVALRRRFAFVNLNPLFNDAWRSHLLSMGVAASVAEEIRLRMVQLNQNIAVDRRVGPAFVVGHSFVTPHETIVVGDGGADWFRGVVRTEIQPLLEEYFMDDPANVEKLVNQLLGVDA